MIYEKIDLYKYFGINRNNNEGGFLTTFVSDQVIVKGEIRPFIRPAMIVIPGGGYRYVSSREDEPISIRFMDKGYSTFSLTYSCEKPHPIPLIEACMAVLYIKENATKYYVDVNHIAAVGFSAGGHLAACLATLSQSPEIQEVFKEKTPLLKLNGVILSYPVIDLAGNPEYNTRKYASGDNPSRYEYLSLQNHVTKDTCPAFIWCTKDDKVVPCANSIIMKEAYDKAGVKTELVLYESGPHGLSLANSEVYNITPENEETFKKVENWTDRADSFLKEIGFKAYNI